MWCKLCIRQNKKSCLKHKNPEETKGMALACDSHFKIDAKKVTPELMNKAVEFNNMPRTKLMVFMALLDQILRLKSQDLHLGLSLHYPIDVNATGKKNLHEVFLVSAPKDKNEASGVAFCRNGGKDFSASVSLEKTRFMDSRDSKLKDMWTDLLKKLRDTHKPTDKKKLLRETLHSMGKEYVETMLQLNGIRMNVKNKKLQEVVDILLRDFGY